MVAKKLKNLLSLTFLLFVGTTGIAWSAHLKDAHLASMPSQTRVVFEFRGELDYKIFSIAKSTSKSARLVIDMKSSTAVRHLRNRQFNKGFVEKIRTGVRGRNGLRVVIDVNRNFKYRHFTIKPSGRDGHRLVVDLYRKGARIPSQYKRDIPATAVASKTERKPALESVRVAENRSVKATVMENRNFRQSRRPILPPVKTRDVVVAIDAGHGGQDPGAIGRYGTREKDIVLKMARDLEKLVRKTPGMRPVMIRTGDYFVSLEGRRAIARKHRADLFISIHADAARRRSASGVSVYTLSRRGASSQAAQWLADRENRSDIIGGVKVHKHDKGLVKVLLDLSQTSTNKASDDLANSVLRALRMVADVHGRGRGKAGFVVLKSPDVPSILVETGFISNPGEESRLRRRHYRERIARSLLRGIVNYFMVNAPPDTVFAKRKHIIAKGESLRDIANRYQVSVSTLKRANGIRSNRARVGRVLTIPRAIAMSIRKKYNR